MDTGLLHEFVVLVEHLNYSTAAKMMNMSQSTLSRHIGELERFYGARLFNRSEGLTLTYAGQVLLEELSDLFAVEDRIKERVKAAKNHYRGTVYVEDYEFSHEVRNFFLRSINLFREENPEVMFEFRRVKHNLAILDSVAEGYFNVGVLVKSGAKDAAVPRPEGFRILPLRHMASRLMIYAHKSAVAHTNGGPVSLKDFKDVPFLMPLKSEYASFRNDLVDLCAQSGFAPNFLLKEIHTYEQLALFEMKDCVQIVRQGDVDNPSSPFLMNPSCEVVELQEEYYATPYLVFPEQGASELVDAFADYLESLVCSETAFTCDYAGSE